MDINLENQVLQVNSYLNLERKIVGIKFLFDEEEFERSNGRELPHMMAYCTMIRNSTQGKSIKAKLNNFACSSGAKALGLLDVTNEDLSGKRRLRLGTYKDLTICRSISKDMVYCEQKIHGVSIMPLEEFKDEEPNVVIIITDAFNTMRISQAYGYHFGQLKNIKFVGMQAICQEATSYPHEINDMNISMLCSGTRMLCQWKDDELAIGMPYHMFSSIVDGVKNTVNPLERDKNKEEIKNRMEENEIDDLEIVFSKNYDDGLYKRVSKQTRRFHNEKSN